MTTIQRRFLLLAAPLMGISVLLVSACLLLGHTVHPALLAFEVWERTSWDLFAADTGRGLAVNLTRDPHTNERSPTWSSDLRLAYIADRSGDAGLYILSLDSLTPILANGGVQVAPGNGIAWSPGGRLAFVGQEPDSLRNTMYVVDAPGQAPADVSPERDLLNEDNPSWLSDHELVFRAETPSIYPHQVFVRDLRDGSVRRISHLRESSADPRASPSDRTITYRAFDPGELTIVWRTYLWREPDGATLLRTDDSDLSAYATWYSAGQWAFVGVNASSGWMDIYLWDATLHDLIKLTDDDAFDTNAVLLSDQTVAFLSDRGGRTGVYVLDVDTRAIREVFSGTGRDGLARGS